MSSWSIAAGDSFAKKSDLKAPTNPHGVREGFWMVFALLGEALLYLCFATPFALDKNFIVLSLMEPPQAQIFGTVMPYYTVIQLLALILGGALLLLGPHRAVVTNWAFTTYFAVNLIGIATLPFLVKSGQPIYWDFALELLRLSSMVILAGAVLEARKFNPLLLVRCLLIVLSVPLVYLAASNPTEFLHARSGRVNGPGLEITSTGHVAALALLLGICVRLPARYRIPLIGLATVMLLLSGARIPLALAVIIIVVKLWRETERKARRFALVSGVAAITLILLVLAQSKLIAGGRVGSLTGSSSSLTAEYAVGRGVAAMTAGELLAAHPFGYVDSDWSIQDGLVDLGWPSHTHSNYFQSYLRFGPLALVFWGVLIWRTRKGSRLGSPYTSCLWFVLIGSTLDYYGFVTKAMLVVFMIYELNEAHIRRASDESPLRRIAITNQACLAGRA